MSYIYLLFLFEIFLFLLAYFLSEKDILSPSVVMCGMFLISTSFAIACVDIWNVNMGFDSCMILSTGIFTFILAEAFYKLLKNKGHLYFSKTKDRYVIQEIEPIDVKTKYLVMFIVLDVITLLWYVLEMQRIVGGGFANLLLLTTRYRALTLHTSISDKIEGINMILSQLLKVTEALGYISAYIFANNHFSKKNFSMKTKKRNQICLMWLFVLAMIPQLLVGGRLTVLMLICSLIVSFYIVWNQKYHWKKTFSWKFIRIALAAVVIGIPLFYYSQIWLGRTATLDVMQYTAKYLGSSIQLFDLYVKNPVEANAFGEESMIGVMTLLYRFGLVPFVREVHLERRVLSAHNTSNVYTFFRRPLHDFGLIGMYVFTILIALFFSWMYNGKIKRKVRTDKTNIYSVVYGYFYIEIVLSSIEQYTCSLLSVNALLKVAIMVVIMKIFMYTSKCEQKRIRQS